MDMLEEKLRQFSLSAGECLDELWSVVMSGPALSTQDANAAAPVLSGYIDSMRRIGAAADTTGLIGLSSACATVEANLLGMAREMRALTQAEADVLTTWPQQLLGYVISQGGRDAGEALIEHLALPAWPLALRWRRGSRFAFANGCSAGASSPCLRETAARLLFSCRL